MTGEDKRDSRYKTCRVDILAVHVADNVTQARRPIPEAELSRPIARVARSSEYLLELNPRIESCEDNQPTALGQLCASRRRDCLSVQGRQRINIASSVSGAHQSARAA